MSSSFLAQAREAIMGDQPTEAQFPFTPDGHRKLLARANYYDTSPISGIRVLVNKYKTYLKRI